MKNSIKTLIVGGTGTLGQQIVHTLLDQPNYTIRVMTRKPQKAAHWQNTSVEIIQGDLIDEASLNNACMGMDIVIASAHGLMGKGKYASEKVDMAGHKALIDASKNAGVRKMIYMSVIGARPDAPVDFWHTKYDIEQYLQNSGLNYTIIRAPAFMETHIHELLGKSILEKGKATIFGKGENPTNFVSVADISQLIKMIIDNPNADNQIIEIGGPDNMTKNEVAALYGRIANKSVKLSHLSPRFLKIMSKIIKPLHPGIARVMRLSAYFDETDQTFDSQLILNKYPIELTSINDFIKSKIRN